MVMFRRVEELEAGVEPPLTELLGEVGGVLRAGGVAGAFEVRGDEVVGRRELVHALRVLGVAKVPVAESSSEVRAGFYRLEELGFYEDVKGDAVKVYESALELLVKGWPTPLVKLRTLSSAGRSVWAKLECFNPFSNSVKDRIGWAMVEEARRGGRLGKLLYEATSTNTGIALAAMAAIMGLKVRLYVPMTIQKVSDIYLRAYGAEVVRVPKPLTVEAVEDVEREAGADGATHLNQFENDANFKVHLRYTAKELDYQLRVAGIRPRLIVGGLGTSGHLSAITYYFKNRYGVSVKVVGVQPREGEVIPGIRRIESGMRWVHWVEVDEVVDVGLNEAVEEALRITRSEGIFIGLSSGAVAAALRKLGEVGGDVVMVFPDSGYKYFEQIGRYLSEKGGE